MAAIDLETGAFGRTLAEAFYLDDAPVIVSTTAGGAVLALTELGVDVAEHPTTKPIPAEDAFLVSVHLREHPAFRVWEEGVLAPPGHVDAWQTVIHDLRRNPKLGLENPIHSMNFYIPRQALDDAAEACEAKPIGDLAYEPGVAITDDTISNLIRILMSASRQPTDFRPPLFDHVCLALVSHVAQAYGGMTTESRVKRGGLAPWQQKRVLDIIGSRTDGTLTVGDLAQECRISHRHFCRAFRQSMGTAPHLFMQNARIEQAKALLAETDTRLGEVGLACGFADQSHFTRVFAQLAGMTPGAWRRNACPTDLRG
jgi:AraC family transcriptional regulator